MLYSSVVARHCPTASGAESLEQQYRDRNRRIPCLYIVITLEFYLVENLKNRWITKNPIFARKTGALSYEKGAVFMQSLPGVRVKRALQSGVLHKTTESSVVSLVVLYSPKHLV